MNRVIDAVRGWFANGSEPALHLIDEAIENLKQSDREIDRRIEELSLRMEVETRRPCDDDGGGDG